LLAVEVFGGLWDALISDRVDLAIGAPAGDSPLVGGFTAQEIARIEFAFMVPPTHPLANAPEPLTSEDILPHRAVSATETSRNLPPRPPPLLSGQDLLCVPDVHHKIAAQLAGLGVGCISLASTLRAAA
jgi:DNA-binding transcriptional LysR family regulator